MEKISNSTKLDYGFHEQHFSCLFLFLDSGEKLDWGIRYKVALGTAEGLMYLHEDCQRRIIHKDVKAANILLSQDFEPQVAASSC